MGSVAVLDVLRYPLLERLELVVELLGGRLLVRVGLADEPGSGVHGRAPGGFFGIGVVAAGCRDLGRSRLDLVQVDVGVLAALLFVVLDPNAVALELPGLFPYALAEGRVLVAVAVAHDIAHVAALRLERAHVGDRHDRFHAGAFTRGGGSYSSRGPDQKASPTVISPAVSAWWRSECSSPSSAANIASAVTRRTSPLPPRWRSTIRAQRRPSAMAVTTSDWPIRASPQANTPSTRVPYTGALTFPRGSVSRPRSSTGPSCSGWEKPMAMSTRSQGSLHSLPGIARTSRDDVPSTRRARTASTRPSSPTTSITSAPNWRSPPSSSA